MKYIDSNRNFSETSLSWLKQPVLLISPAGEIMYANKQIIQLLKSSRVKHDQGDVFSFLNIKKRQAFLEKILRVADSGKAVKSRIQLVNSSGAKQSFLLTIAHYSGKAADTVLILILKDSRVETDITGISVAKEHDSLQDYYIRRLQLLNEVTASVTGEISVEELADKIVKEIVKAFDVDSCVLRIIEGEQLILLGWVGIPEEKLQRSIPIGLGLAARILSSREPVSVYNVDENPITKNIRNFHSNAYHFVSYAGAPLLIRGRAIGVLGIYSEKSLRSFTSEDLRHLQIAANHVAAALENSRLFRLLAKRNDDLMLEIEERVRAQQALASSEEKFFKAFYTSPDAININRMSDGLYVEINNGFTRLTGYSKQDVEGKTTKDIDFWVSLADKTYMLDAIKEKNEISDFEAEFLVKDNSIITGLVSASIIEIEGERCILMITRDISQRKKAEKEITRINRELTSLNRIILNSARFMKTEELLDYVLDEILGLVDFEGGTICLIDPDDSLRLITQLETAPEVLNEFNVSRLSVGDCFCGATAAAKCPMVLRGGEMDSAPAAKKMIYDSRINYHAAFPIVSMEKCLGVFCIFTRKHRILSEKELSLVQTIASQVAIALERTKYFEELQKQAGELEIKVKERTSQLEAANRELEAFSYSVSHDLRAPLRAIDGFSLALIEDFSAEIDDTGKKYLNRIRLNSQKMALLIDDILQMSRLTRKTVNRDTVNLTDIVHDIMKDFTDAGQNPNLHLEIEENMRDNADPQLIRSCFLNLIDNAIKFSSSKPEIKIIIGTLRNNEKITYFVQDNGVGFDMRYYSKLFGVFQRLHTEEEFPGTGVGLATVQRIIHKHGGKIWAESRLNEGTTFYFTLKENE